MEKVKSFFKENVDTKVVVSTAIGLGVFGLVTYLAVRSGLKPLQTAAKAVGGK